MSKRMDGMVMGIMIIIGIIGLMYAMWVFNSPESAQDVSGAGLLLVSLKLRRAVRRVKAQLNHLLDARFANELQQESLIAGLAAWGCDDTPRWELREQYAEIDHDIVWARENLYNAIDTVKDCTQNRSILTRKNRGK